MSLFLSVTGYAILFHLTSFTFEPLERTTIFYLKKPLKWFFFSFLIFKCVCMAQLNPFEGKFSALEKRKNDEIFHYFQVVWNFVHDFVTTDIWLSTPFVAKSNFLKWYSNKWNKLSLQLFLVIYTNKKAHIEIKLRALSRRQR